MKLTISAPLSLGDTIAKRLARYYAIQLEKAPGPNCAITATIDGRQKIICSFKSDLDISYIIELFWLKIKTKDWLR